MEKEERQVIVQIIILFIVMIILSIIIAFVYLWYFIDKKLVSNYLFIPCFIYFTFFVFLQFLVNFDVIFRSVESQSFKVIESSFKGVRLFYIIFKYFNKFVSFFIFIYLGYIKSGYISRSNKFLDAIFFSHFKKIIFGLIVILFAIILFIIKKSYLIYFGGLILTAFNFFIYVELIKVYLNVGFFIVQICIDCKRIRNEKLIIRYNNYLIIKLREKEKKSIEKIKNVIKKLNVEETKQFINNKNKKEFYFIESLIEELKSKKEIYKIDIDKENENNMKKNENDLDKENENNIKNGEDLNEIGNNENEENEQNEEQNEKQIILNENNLTEKDLAPYISAFKKYMRRIIRIKYLRENIEKNINKNLNKKILNKICLTLKYILYFIVFIIIIFSDYLMPIAAYNDDSETKSSENESSSSGFGSFILGLILFIIISILNSSYTIAILFSINKRQFISGELFYGKNKGDHINLIETINTLSSFVYPLSYCNLYFYYIALKYNDSFLTPTFYEIVKIPDYSIKGGFSVLMIIKIALSLVFAVLSHCFQIKNDLGEYNRYIYTKNCKYDYLNEEDIPKFSYKLTDL